MIIKHFIVFNALFIVKNAKNRIYKVTLYAQLVEIAIIDY